MTGTGYIYAELGDLVPLNDIIVVTRPSPDVYEARIKGKPDGPVGTGDDPESAVVHLKFQDPDARFIETVRICESAPS